MLEEFRQLGLSEESLEALQAKGFEQPTEIQKQCIPLLLKDKMDVIGQAQTGTGKTAAFALPIIEMLDKGDRAVQALILTPTRELCIQECTEINSLAGTRNIEVAPIYGGASMEAQLRQLKHGVNIVVGTPGRILDHLQRGTLDISHIKCFVLDEADEMLDMGFIEDIETILEAAPQEKRMLCFSATMPEPILKLAARFMPNYKLVRTQTEDMTSSLTEQVFYETRECDKLEVLMRVIEITKDFYGLVFCRTKIQCDEVGARLIERGYNAEVLHGDLSQKQRELIIRKMRGHYISILVATDVAARGIDLPDLTHVINYSLPQDPETYIHRVGRTGRAGQKGTAITFVNSSEFRKFAFIKKVAKSEIAKAQVPTIEQIEEAKQQRIEATIASVIAPAAEASAEIDPKFTAMAEKISEGHDSTRVIAALLSLSFQRELDTSRFKSILDLYRGKRGEGESSGRRREERENSAQYAGIDDQGFTRLFIARGENDGISKRDLVEFLISKTGASNDDIRQVEVHDDFSFVTAPAQIAETILTHMGGSTKGGKPIVTRAREFSSRDRGHDRPPRSPRKRRSNSEHFENIENKIGEEEIDFLRYAEESDRKMRRISTKPKSKKKKKN
ncbi:MAG: DEAD/DEAH box helicase [Sphaerochaetaceae bacterium]|nr:DEAD/DEAH box helicase [Sphaerochaetaceae bacterium]MDD4397193.1 DEAD/DEAH box helicase [Sphaerochaetaceae bacterium]